MAMIVSFGAVRKGSSGFSNGNVERTLIIIEKRSVYEEEDCVSASFEVRCCRFVLQ